MHFIETSYCLCIFILCRAILNGLVLMFCFHICPYHINVFMGINVRMRKNKSYSFQFIIIYKQLHIAQKIYPKTSIITLYIHHLINYYIKNITFISIPIIYTSIYFQTGRSWVRTPTGSYQRL
jgi:hypothetical protein